MARAMAAARERDQPAVVILVENEHHRVEEFWRQLIDGSGRPRPHVLEAPELAFPTSLAAYVVFVPSPEQEGQVEHLRRELATDRILFDLQVFWEPSALFQLLDEVIESYPGGRFLVLWDDHLNAHYTHDSGGMSLGLAERFRQHLRASTGGPEVEICGISAHGSEPAHTQQIVAGIRDGVLSDYRDRSGIDHYIAQHFAAARLLGQARIGGMPREPIQVSRDDVVSLRQQIREATLQRFVALGRDLRKDPELVDQIRLSERDPVYGGGFVLHGPERSLLILEHRERDRWFDACVQAGRKRDWPEIYRRHLVRWILGEPESVASALVWTRLSGGPLDDLSDRHPRTFLHLVTHDGWHKSGDLVREAILEFGTFGDQASTLRARISKFRDDVGRSEILASDRAFGYRCFQDYLLVGVDL